MSACEQIDRSFYGSLSGQERSTFFASATETRRYAVKEGYGAWFSFIYNGENEDELDEDGIADTESGVVRISPATCSFMGNTLCVRVGRSFGIPVVNFRDAHEDDDSYDGICTDRWFETEAEALDHVRVTMLDCEQRGLVQS